MSIANIKAIFAAVSTCEAWSLQLLQIKTSRQTETSYCGREITLSPTGALASFVDELSERYISESKGIINTYQGIIDYDGSTIDKTVYRLNSSNILINSEYEKFISAIANPDAEIDPLKFKAQAYLIKGLITLNGEENPVKLISMQNPITSLQHKYFCNKGTFKEISEKVISLKTSIDVVISNDNVYMLTLEGEKLFNMDRAYKAVCETKLQDIKHFDIVTDFSAFEAVAGKGHNPRKFVSFDNDDLHKLTNPDTRREMARQFNIPINGDKFDTSQPDTSDKLVKLLCNRGMIKPLNRNPVEVAGAKKWE